MANPQADTHFGQLQYPRDMNAKDTYFPEAIKFHFQRRVGVELDKVMNATSAAHKAAQGGTEVTNMSEEAFRKSKMAEYEDKAKKAEKDVTDSERDDWRKKIGKEFAAGVAGGRAFFKSIKEQNTSIEDVGDIYLNMPNNIALSEAAGWGGESLGVVGALTQKALKGGDGTTMQKLAGAGAGSAGNLLSAAAGGIVGTVLSKIPGVNTWSGGLLGAIGGETLQKGGESAFSVKQNPYMEMMFSGIGFRSFKFDFIFRARNKSEIETVAYIIKMFRQHSRPSWVGGRMGKSFMRYPEEYKIQFLTEIKGEYKQNDHLPILKPCVCSSVETNFTPDNIWAAYDFGAPVAITLGLTFNETALVMSNDIAEEWPNQSNPQGIDRNYGADEFGPEHTNKSQR